MEHSSQHYGVPDLQQRKRNRVRELREDKLMTQAQLAKKARVALRTIHSVEKGMNCRMDTKRKILLALGVPFEQKRQVFRRRPSTIGRASPASAPRHQLSQERGGRPRCQILDEAPAGL